MDLRPRLLLTLEFDVNRAGQRSRRRRRRGAVLRVDGPHADDRAGTRRCALRRRRGACPGDVIMSHLTVRRFVWTLSSVPAVGERQRYRYRLLQPG
jgi:hypothetical protein